MIKLARNTEFRDAVIQVKTEMKAAGFDLEDPVRNLLVSSLLPAHSRLTGTHEKSHVDSFTSTKAITDFSIAGGL
jgi:hypothetical protein